MKSISRIRALGFTFLIAAGIACASVSAAVFSWNANITGNAQKGAVVFRWNCSSCHVLKAAGATGVVGPNLDKLVLPEAVVIAQVQRGGGVMPAYRTILTKTQIQNVAAYVYRSTHR
jgi:mono/diheme cytochrome c family protein